MAESIWNHNLCKDCFAKERPGIRPVTIKDAPYATCCWCRKLNRDGIWMRKDPDDAVCEGKHLICGCNTFKSSCRVRYRPYTARFTDRLCPSCDEDVDPDQGTCYSPTHQQIQ